MRLHLTETLAAAAIVLSGAAHADVTVSQSNDPSPAMGAELAALLGAEHQTLNALPEAQLTEIAQGPEGTGNDQWDCLREAIYFEARGEDIQGQVAVGEVVLNRVDAAGFPKTVCGVVKAKGQGDCAFSYVCDGRADVMSDALARDRAGRIARTLLEGAPRALTHGATFFHASYVRPNFGDVTRTAEIGGHLFYRMN